MTFTTFTLLWAAVVVGSLILVGWYRRAPPEFVLIHSSLTGIAYLLMSALDRLVSPFVGILVYLVSILWFVPRLAFGIYFGEWSGRWWKKKNQPK